MHRDEAGDDPGAGQVVVPPDGESREREVTWGIGDAAAGFLLGNLAVLVIIGLWALVTGQRELTFGSFILGQAALWAGLAGAPLVASRRKGSGHLSRDFGLDLRLRDAAFGVPVGLVCQLVLVPLIYWPLQRLIDTTRLDQSVKQLVAQAHGPALVVVAVFLVVGAPLVEELFFRGLLMRALARRFGDRWAVAGSALVFALAHIEPVQYPALLAVGLVFAVLALRSGRLGPSIWAHATFNAVVVVLLVAQR